MEISSKMKAAVLMGPNDLRLKEVDTPQPGPDDVLIRVEAVAVCSSDVALIAKPWPFQPPYGSFIPGHEYAGTIVAVGQNVDRVKVGDRVAVEAHLGCLRCRNCRLGNYTACLNYGQKGHRANGFTTNGGFAQYVVNHINTVHPIPDTMGFDEAALITNLGCVLYGFQTVGGYIVGDTVAVIGPGPLGLISVAVAKALCAQRVFLVGTRPARLNVGLELGADRVINVKEEDALRVVLEETKGIGADLVVESSGAPGAINMAIHMAKRMGKILMLGLPEEEVSVDLNQLGQENKSIHTVRGEGWANCGRAVSLAGSGRVNLKRLVTHSFVFDQISEAFKTFVERIGGAIKVTVHPNA
jgi:2-desacetyl-2-hydroxyethyl bacteriochlorophyllide A dehydrogenase